MMENKNHCPNCGSATCPHCGKAQPACTTHCYCQAVYIGSAYHKVCCKCGDRVAATAPNPYPVYPYNPNWYWNPAWGPWYYQVTCGGSTNATSGYAQLDNSSAAPMANDIKFAQLSNAGAEQIDRGDFIYLSDLSELKAKFGN